MTNVYSYTTKQNSFPKDSVFVLGAFESIHKGHLSLFEEAKKISPNVVAVMFSNPEDLPKNTRESFMELSLRVQMLANLGIENILLIDFDEKIQSLEGDKFIDSLVQLGANHFVVGKDYKFGKFGTWNAEKLQNYFPKTTICDFVKMINNTKISTSILKENIGFGEVEFVNNFLVEPYKIEVKPNSNNEFNENAKLISLARGIYIIHYIEDGIKYHGLAHFNWNKELKSKIILFNYGKDLSLETFRNGVLEIIKAHRIIISQRMNEVLATDEEEIEKYFKAKIK